MPTVAFHGSSEDDPEFAIGHVGTNSHTLCGDYEVRRYGVFFSDSPDFSAIYGKVGAYELSLDSTLELGSLGGQAVIQEFVDGLDPFSGERDLWIQAKEIAGRRLPLWHLFDGEIDERFHRHLTELGHDSVSFCETNEADDGNELGSVTTVVLDAGKIVRIRAHDPDAGLSLSGPQV